MLREIQSMMSTPVAGKGKEAMPDTSGLSEAKRALLEKYLHGDIPQAARPASVGTLHAKTEVAGSRARAVGVQVGGSKRPFFFLHGDWKGTAFFCFSLARELGSEQPFYALEAYRFDGLPVPPTVETMAAAHIELMRAVQPEGPYLLGGWCNGGLVAYEMAQQLHTAGQTVDLLVLIDAIYLGYRSRRRLLRVVISRLGDLIGLAPDKQLDWFLRLRYVCKPLRSMMHALLHVYRRLQNVRHEGSQDSIRLIINDVISFARQKVMTSIKRFIRMFELDHGPIAPSRLDLLAPTTKALRQDYPGIFEWTDMGYIPPSLYPGKITFFWDSEEPWRRAGWRRAVETNEIEVHIIPGTQMACRTEYLHILAEHLRVCLSKVQVTE
jgi:hypothetical protein